MFGKSNSNNLHNTAIDGSVAATNINAPVTIQNINEKLCKKNDIIGLLLSSNPSDWTYDDDRGVYIYSNDISLQIKEDRTEDFVQFDEPWVKNYSDPIAHKALFRLFYNANELETFYFASVDGARMFIPYPLSQTNLRISKKQYLIGMIINYPFQRNYSFDDYLQRADIVVDVNM